MANKASSILVTGGTQGMGYHCTRAIAGQCPDTLVVIASRTDPNDAAATINKALNQSNVEFMPLDLSFLSKVRDFAKRWEAEKRPPIQALVFNAAGQWPGVVEYTDDGIEKNFAVNHLGHALLFHLLAGKLVGDARIVVVSSGVHDPEMGWGMIPNWTTAEEMARPSKESEKRSNGMDRYAASKVANILWMLALSRRLSASSAHANKTVVAFDPGLMPGTGLQRNWSWFARWLIANVLPKMVPLLRVVWNQNIHLSEESGESLAWLVVGEEVRGKGIYYEGRMEQKTAVVTRDEGLQEDLWGWTVERVSEGREEREAFGRLD
ncbi:NAD(P)-binding protein [Trematosphaeria pertusa]|uniref:NAD(P)-binding protein n=1 Tax=Trematosphaeria pertusa TaxID=390896 RepID=A0A6A6IQC0_9PLEO|nr:NAD(P)-binding protein [Trematosphaeria pertusa]KAF2252671.1 NAD(P)-binding protein [Trematosphaeria pertusa]